MNKSWRYEGLPVLAGILQVVKTSQVTSIACAEQELFFLVFFFSGEWRQERGERVEKKKKKKKKRSCLYLNAHQCSCSSRRKATDQNYYSTFFFHFTLVSREPNHPQKNFLINMGTVSNFSNHAVLCLLLKVLERLNVCMHEKHLKHKQLYDFH